MPVEIKDYPPNSDKSKREGTNHIQYNKPKLSGKVAVRKNNTVVQQLKSQTEELKQHAIEDVILPGLRDAVWDIFTTTLSSLLYGTTGAGPRRQNGSRPFTSSINYASTNSYNRMGRPQSSPNKVAKVKPRPEEELIFACKADAEAALDALRESVASYGVVSVQSLFEMCDRTAPFTSNKYGWMDLEDAYIERVREGYILRMPRSLPLE